MGSRREGRERVGDGLKAALRERVSPLRGDESDYDALLAAVGGARVVFLGASCGGTHDFVRERAAISRRLVREHGFSAVVIDDDWPDAYRVNRFVRDRAAERDAEEALAGFDRFPAWAWRNADVIDFVIWLRAYNRARSRGERSVGFFGLDLRAQHACRAEIARQSDDGYGFEPPVSADGLRPGAAEEAMIARLIDLRRAAVEYASAAPLERDEAFYIEQSARAARDAEAYYRALVREDALTAQALRTRHTAEVLDALLGHLEASGSEARVVVWTTAAQAGARAGADGTPTLADLARERLGNRVAAVALTTYAGTVTAACRWGGPSLRKNLRRAVSGSYEALFHGLGLPAFLLDLKASDPAVRALEAPRAQRSVEAVYTPELETQRHYRQLSLPQQFDWVLHVDDSRAVVPLEPTPEWVLGEPPPARTPM